MTLVCMHAFIPADMGMDVDMGVHIDVEIHMEIQTRRRVESSVMGRVLRY